VAVNGVFKVDYSWLLYQDFYGNILIHSVPYTQAGEVKYYDRPDALGLEPTSHGCVRISEEDAAWLKTWNPVSATIQITAWPGEIK
jgi:lipoprotein-anchoring transpeptidase ErfK/SrfK